LSSFVADITLAALPADTKGYFTAYESILRSACELNPPPFGQAWYGETYRKLAIDPVWLAQSLISNAVKEGEGSRKLWALVARVSDTHIREAIRQHAVDESRHAQYYLAMLDIVFPNATDRAFRAQLQTISPGYKRGDRPDPQTPSTEELVLDEIVQMNIGEIRTRIHQLLMRPIISAHCSEKNRPKLQKILDTLLDDETRHIAYTARIIDDNACAGLMKFLTQTMTQRIADFNEITLNEVAAETFDGG
jgi:hypothetical protein